MQDSPDIRTERLLISPFSESHLTPRYIGWLNDPDLMCYSEQRHKTHTINSCYDYWQSFKGTSNYFLAIEEIFENIGHIGNITAYIDENNLLADLSILIGEKKVQSKRYGTEAWVGVCDFLFNKLKIRKLTAGTISVNLPMKKLMHSVGMIDDGIRKKHYIYDGKEADIIYKALFKKQWDKRSFRD